MHRLNTTNPILPPEVLLLYSEQLNAQSSWFILNPKNNQIILRNKSFNIFFTTYGDYNNLSLDNLPITQKSCNDLVNKINHASMLNQFIESLTVLEMQSGKTITLWLSLQPIIIGNTPVAILVNAQQLDTPTYLTRIFKRQLKNQEWNIGNLTSNYGIQNTNKVKKNTSNAVDNVNNNYDTINNNYNLSNSEQSILNLILAGFSQKEVCNKLNLSRTRVTQYISRICHKCGYEGYSGKYLKKHFNITCNLTPQ